MLPVCYTNFQWLFGLHILWIISLRKEYMRRYLAAKTKAAGENLPRVIDWCIRVPTTLHEEFLALLCISGIIDYYRTSFLSVLYCWWAGFGFYCCIAFLTKCESSMSKCCKRIPWVSCKKFVPSLRLSLKLNSVHIPGFASFLNTLWVFQRYLG